MRSGYLLMRFLEDHDVGWVIGNDAGVITERGVVLDPEPQTAHVFSGHAPPRTLGIDDKLTLPGVLDDFAARVGLFFA